MPRPKKRAACAPRPERLEVRLLLDAEPMGLDPIGAIRGAMTPFGLEAGKFATDHIIVRYRDDHVAQAKPHPFGMMPGLSLGTVEGLRVVGINPALGVEATLAAARRDPAVLYAEPDYLISAAVAPNDPRFPEQWGLSNPASSVATTGSLPIDADIDATTAWQTSTGNRSVVVAVLDSGVDYAHPDLAANIWTNRGEVPGNGIDDDNNGYVDDIRGWDFVNRDNDPRDDNSHGTHVAGTIGAVGDNGAGISGVAWRVSLMPLKVLDRNGNGSISSAIDAISYAYRNGAVISNISWGGTQYSQALRDVIETAGASTGHLVVAASGNSGRALDAPGSPRFYPASYDLPNIVSVAASDRSDQRASFSNFGQVSVDLAAPGVDILSTTPGGAYSFKSGTSMAAPHVTGAAALLKAIDPTLDAQKLASALIGSADRLPSLAGTSVSGGRLNVAKAVQEVRPQPRLRGGVVEVPANGEWTRVTLDESYASMVVATTPVVQPDGQSLVTRVRNAQGNSFEVSVVTAEGISTSAIPLSDGGFEVPEAGPNGSSGSYLYRPAGSAWSFAGTAGVT
ncbi:S8 family peptidase, partial [Tautonia sociabilis]